MRRALQKAAATKRAIQASVMLLRSTAMPSLSLSPAGPAPFIPPAHARSLSSFSSRSSGSGGSGGREQSQEQAQEQERDIRQPSMDVEKDVATALRGVQELHRAGRYKEALEASLGMRDWLERELGEDHPVYASCLNNIALFHKLTNEFDEAVHWYYQALHKYKHTVGEQHRSYAATLNNLGLVFLAQAQQAEAQGKGKVQSSGYLESAEATLREALRIREQILEEDDAGLANTRTNLASVLQRTGRAGEAEEMLRTSLARIVEKRGPESPEAALCLANLSFLLKSEGRLEEALGFAKDALAARRAVHRGHEDHPSVIVAMNNLAEVHMAKGEEADAVALQGEILRILRRAALAQTIDWNQRALMPANQAAAAASVGTALEGMGIRVHAEWLEACLAQLPPPPPGPPEQREQWVLAQVYDRFLHSDLNASGRGGAFPPGLGGMREHTIQGTHVLQVDALKNISQPAETRSKPAAPGPGRCLLLALTDGSQRAVGMEYGPIPDLRVDTAQGLKVAVNGCRVKEGVLILVKEGLQVLGGNNGQPPPQQPPSPGGSQRQRQHKPQKPPLPPPPPLGGRGAGGRGGKQEQQQQEEDPYDDGSIDWESVMDNLPAAQPQPAPNRQSPSMMQQQQLLLLQADVEREVEEAMLAAAAAMEEEWRYEADAAVAAEMEAEAAAAAAAAAAGAGGDGYQSRKRPRRQSSPMTGRTSLAASATTSSSQETSRTGGAMGRRGQTAAAAGVKLSYEEDEEVIVLSGDD